MSELCIYWKVREAVRGVTFLRCCNSRSCFILTNSGDTEQRLRGWSSNTDDEKSFLTALRFVRNDDRLAAGDTDLDTAIRLAVPRLRLPAIRFHTWYAPFPGERREPE